MLISDSLWASSIHNMQKKLEITIRRSEQGKNFIFFR